MHRIGAFSVCHFFNSFLIYASNEENTLLAEVFDECRDSFRIYSKTGYKKTAVKCSMFYNSLLQSVFDFWIELSKKVVAKLQKKVNDFSVKSGSKNIRGLGILPYGNLRDMPVA